jgi:hypothetical protein
MLPSDLLKFYADVRLPRPAQTCRTLPARFARLSGTVAIIFGRESAALGISASAATRAAAAGPVTIAVAVKSTAASAARTCAATSAGRGLGTSFINLQIAASDCFSIEACNGLGRFGVIWHFDECESASAPGLSIHGNVNTRDLAERFKHPAKFRLGRLKAHVPYKQVLHVLLSFNL